MTELILPKLSFCIPTYNNVNELKSTVESILNQLEESDSVEIVISDNCSQDDTEIVALEFCMRYPFISYVRNEKNIGVGRNIYNVLKSARGEFLWLLGDDKLLSGAISSVQAAIRNCRKIPSTIFVNWKSVWPNSYQGKRQNIDIQTNLKVGHDQEVDGVNAYLDLRLPYFPFMSAHLFNRNFLDFSFLEKYMDCNWPQLYILFSVLNKNPRSLHVSHVCIEDDHTSKARRVIPSDPWPTDVFTSQLVRVVLDQKQLQFISEDEAHKILRGLYDYTYCDPVSFKEYLFVLTDAKNELIEEQQRLAYTYISRSMSKNQGLAQQVFVQFLAKIRLSNLIINLSFFFAACYKLLISSSQSAKKIVIVFEEGFETRSTVAIIANPVISKPVFITTKQELADSEFYGQVHVVRSDAQCLFILAKYYQSSHVIFPKKLNKVQHSLFTLFKFKHKLTERLNNNLYK
jgi:glycosyltransferase involved in cell wall biosynthesis